MKFIGISKTFSTINEQQYQAIGEYWDFFSDIFGRENIKGLGFNWQNGTSLEYVIGLTDKKLDFNLKQIAEKFPDAQFKEINLPESGWKKYSGRTENLGSMYAEIYKDGPLTYEIESFDDNGNCSVEITRE